MTDLEIIQLVKENKHHPAIKKLYAYFPVVKKHIIQNNGSKIEAEDIFQEALVILIHKINTTVFEPKSTLNTYLFGVCKILWFEQLRLKKKMITSSSYIEENAYYEDDFETDNKDKRAQEAILSIGKKCQELLQFFYFNNLSMKEIAIKLGFSSEKVAKNQKYRCIEKAKEYLKANPIVD